MIVFHGTELSKHYESKINKTQPLVALSLCSKESKREQAKKKIVMLCVHELGLLHCSDKTTSNSLSYKSAHVINYKFQSCICLHTC